MRFHTVNGKPIPIAGSATVILAAAGEGGIVHVANLGDCGVRIVRDGECSFASTVSASEYQVWQLCSVVSNQEGTRAQGACE